MIKRFLTVAVPSALLATLAWLPSGTVAAAPVVDDPDAERCVAQNCW